MSIQAAQTHPNTPKISPPGVYLISISKTFPVNFHQHTNSRPHASTQHTTKARPWYQAARAARRPVEMQQHVPEPPCYYRPSPSAVCRQPAVPDATPRSPEASNAQRQRQRQRQRRERRSQQTGAAAAAAAAPASGAAGAGAGAAGSSSSPTGKTHKNARPWDLHVWAARSWSAPSS